MKEKLVVIDGNSIINRAFYGLPDLTTTDGRHTNAVLGFINILTRIAEEEKPQYLAVAFDVKHPTFRHEMYPEYKGTRKGMPEELKEQVPLLKQMLHAMNILTVECPGFEADDILGALSERAKRDNKAVTLVSGDRDLLQLADEDVLVRLPKTKRTGTEIEDYTPQKVFETFGVTPKQITDLKGLMGDSSDNIPGVPGVGEKTAVKILSVYPTVEEAIANAAQIEPKKAGNALAENADLARLCKKLATIRTDWEPEFTYEKAVFGNIFTDEAYVLCKELELKSVLSRHFSGVTNHKKSEGISGFSGKCEEWNNKTFDWLLTEAAGKTVGFSVNGKSLFLAFDGKCYEVTEQSAAAVLHEFVRKKCSPATIDLKRYAQLVCPEDENAFEDAALMAYLLNPLKNSYTYEDIARDYLEVLVPSAQELSKDCKPVQLSLFEEEQPDDSIQKANKTIAVYEALVAETSVPVMQKKLETEGMLSLYRDIELPLVYTLFDMEQAGMRIRPEVLEAYSRELSAGIEELTAKIYQMAGEEFNINSPKQLGTILFEKLKLPGGKKTKTGYSTSADVLEKLKIEDPIVEAILDYRQLTKLKSTYADGLGAFIESDGRIHSKFNQMITATGRLSSADPNLQNIPVKMELGRKIRKAFVPDEGCCFVDADYSQVELRLLAHLSGDERMILAYREAADIHRMTASQVFHTPYEEVTKQQRSNAKAVNFGIVYGISAFGLSQDLNISRKEAEEYISGYFETYPSIKGYLDRLVESAKETGSVRTLFGRKRPIPEISSSNFQLRSFGERIAMNSPVQGTAADIMKIAMIRVNSALRKEGLKARLVLQVHDELMIETPLEEKERVKELLEYEMKNAAVLSVPLEVSVSEGKDWYETK